MQGVGLAGLSGSSAPLDMGNAGTAMRLFMGLLAGQRFDSVLIGDASLTRRPMQRVAAPLESMGARIGTQQGRPPVQIHGGALLHGIDYQMPIASAQVKSALLLAGLYAHGMTRVTEPRRHAITPSACWAASAWCSSASCWMHGPGPRASALRAGRGFTGVRSRCPGTSLRRRFSCRRLSGGARALDAAADRLQPDAYRAAEDAATDGGAHRGAAAGGGRPHRCRGRADGRSGGAPEPIARDPGSRAAGAAVDR